MPARTWFKSKQGSHYYNGNKKSRGSRIISKMHKGFGFVDSEKVWSIFKKLEDERKEIK